MTLRGQASLMRSSTGRLSDVLAIAMCRPIFNPYYETVMIPPKVVVGVM
jgi:hypothetical protein